VNAGAHAGSGRIVPVTSLSASEMAQILSLKEKCEQRMGIGILLSGDLLWSLDKEGTGAIAFMKEGHFTGFCFFYSFFKEEAEALIFADPDEDWKQVSSLLLEALRRECGQRGHARLLVMNDRRSSSGAELIEEVGGKLSFSEHRMEADNVLLDPYQNIDLQNVGNDDPTLYTVECACNERFCSKPDQIRYLATNDGRPIGKIDVNIEGSIAELTGLCVIPEQRGKGLGRSILSSIVSILRADGMKRIVLDVQTDNDIALSLYLKAGFKKEFTLDYYGFSLSIEDTVGREPRSCEQ
jgi:ribosomal protein S18 acetylase RimI-like enzyme